MTIQVILTTTVRRASTKLKSVVKEKQGMFRGKLASDIARNNANVKATALLLRKVFTTRQIGTETLSFRSLYYAKRLISPISSTV